MKYKPFSILAKQYKMFPSSFSRYQTNKQNDSIFQKNHFKKISNFPHTKKKKKQFPLKQTVNLNNLISKYQKKKKKSLIFLKPNVIFLACGKVLTWHCRTL